MNDNQAICLNCGVAKDTGNAYCPNCGNAVDPNAAVCLNCGVALTKPEENKANANGTDSTYLNGQDKVVIALIAFFLGGIGIHNFMLGESKKGIFRIVTSLCCGIGGIFALIDFIKILMGTYKVDPTKLI